MDIKKKLVLTLTILSATTIFAIMSLFFVLVQDNQGFETLFNITYKSSKSITFNVSGVDNLEDYFKINFVNEYTIDEPDIPKIHNKMLVDWYLDENFTTKAEFPITVQTNTVLYPYLKDGTIDSYIEWNAEGYYQVKNTRYKKVAGVTECVIPDFYDDGTNGLHAVTKFAGAFFKEVSSGLTDVYIGNNITAITPRFSIEHLSMKNLILGINLQSIDLGAFQYCGSLESIRIHRNLNSIRIGAFTGCNLKNISVNKGNTVFDSRNDCNAVIETATNTLKWGAQNTVIPNTVTRINDDAFTSSINLTSMTIPASITYVGVDVFSSCRNLTSLTFDNPIGWMRSSGSTIIENISLLDPAQNATWFVSTYPGYYWQNNSNIAI